MKFDLPAMARRAGKRRSVALRPIIPTAAQAQELAAVYLQVVRIWQGVVDPLMAEYDRTLSSMTRDTAADLQGIIDGAAILVARLLLRLTPEVRDWSLRVERWHRGKWQGAALAASGIDISTMLSPTDVTETVETTIARNVALIRNVSDQAQARISDAVFRGVQNRTPAREVAKEVRGAVAMSRRRSVGIASDQLQKLTSSLDRARQEDAGIEQFKWRHSGKLHPRAQHVARDGNIYDWAKPPADLPGQLPYCGCKAQAWMDLD